MSEIENMKNYFIQTTIRKKIYLFIFININEK